jgi:uncharacterized membrane protein
MMMKIFRDPDQRLRWTITSMAALLLIGVSLIVLGIFLLAQRQAKDNAALLGYAQLNDQLWKELRIHNPEIPVPQVEESPGQKSKDARVVVVVPAKPSPSPSPSASASPRVKTRTVIRYKNKPRQGGASPRPWYDYFKTTR